MQTLRSYFEEAFDVTANFFVGNQPCVFSTTIGSFIQDGGGRVVLESRVLRIHPAPPLPKWWVGSIGFSLVRTQVFRLDSHLLRSQALSKSDTVQDLVGRIEMEWQARRKLLPLERPCSRGT